MRKRCCISSMLIVARHVDVAALMAIGARKFGGATAHGFGIGIDATCRHRTGLPHDVSPRRETRGGGGAGFKIRRARMMARLSSRGIHAV